MHGRIAREAVGPEGQVRTCCTTQLLPPPVFWARSAQVARGVGLFGFADMDAVREEKEQQCPKQTFFGSTAARWAPETFAAELCVTALVTAGLSSLRL